MLIFFFFRGVNCVGYTFVYKMMDCKLIREFVTSSFTVDLPAEAFVGLLFYSFIFLLLNINGNEP